MMEQLAEVFTVKSMFTLGMLLFLQIVLGFDNLLYIAIESKRTAPEHQANVRRNRSSEPVKVSSSSPASGGSLRISSS